MWQQNARPDTADQLQMPSLLFRPKQMNQPDTIDHEVVQTSVQRVVEFLGFQNHIPVVGLVVNGSAHCRSLTQVGVVLGVIQRKSDRESLLGVHEFSDPQILLRVCEIQIHQ